MTRVLIVDDDDGWGWLAGRRLERAGFEATFHRGPLGALKAICSGSYDVLLLDVKMPGLDGPRIAHTLHHVRVFPKPKLILCSSMDTEDLQKLTQRLKADGSFSKSAGADKLVQLVRRVLDLHASERGSRIIASKSSDTGATRCPVCGQGYGD